MSLERLVEVGFVGVPAQRSLGRWRGQIRSERRLRLYFPLCSEGEQHPLLVGGDRESGIGRRGWEERAELSGQITISHRLAK